MTMEISEIGIRMRVRDAAEQRSGGQGGCDPSEEEGGEAGGRDEIVQACVRKVLHTLKAMQER